MSGHMLELKPEVSVYLKEQCFQQNKNDGLLSCLRTLASPPLFTTLRLSGTEGRSTEDDYETLKEEISARFQKNGWDEPHIYFHDVIKELVVVKGQGPLTSMPQHQQEVVVDHSCGMAVLRGAEVYAQGILSCLPDLAKGSQVSIFVDLDGKCLKGANTVYSGRKMFIGNGRSHVSRKDLFCSSEPLRGLGVEVTQPLYRMPSLDGLMLWGVFPQNLPSVVCSLVLSPTPGAKVLDMCAAPGGKTTHLGALMKNKGHLIALDKVAHKVDKIRENAERMGLSCVKAFVWDSTKCCSDQASEDLIHGPPFLPASFDYIMLDGPCSALGQRPSMKNTMSLKSLSSYPRLQRKLFQQAVELLRPGGCLVYSTCTITLEENEGIVQWALSSFPTLQLLPQTPFLGMPGRPYGHLFGEQTQLLQLFQPWMGKEDEDEGAESPEKDTIGFFIAKFEKTPQGSGT